MYFKEIIERKRFILAKGSMSNLLDSSISLPMAKYINEINNRQVLFEFVHNLA